MLFRHAVDMINSKPIPGQQMFRDFFLTMNKQIFNRISIVNTTIDLAGALLAALILLLIQLIGLLLIIDHGGRWQW